MNIAYVTTYHTSNINFWSGLGFYMASSLKNQDIAVEYLGPLRTRCSKIFQVKRIYYKYLFNKNYLFDREPFVLKGYAKQIIKKLAGSKTDIIFSPGSIPIAYLEYHRPIVFWTDATFAGIKDYYQEYENLCEETIKYGNIMEESALKRCAIAIYSSQWAANTAINYYKIDKAKVKVVPFGANIDRENNLEEVRDFVNSRPVDKCKLLFIGTDWKRKGGDMAIEVTRQLNKLGLKTELSIVGCHPAIDMPLRDFVIPIGFINKANGKQNIINTLLQDSHFLILPSKADCTPVVLSEASSFGVPSLTTEVGGIPDIVKDGVNGKIFLKNASISEYCSYVIDLFSNYCRYRDLALSSFNEYQSRLNWNVSGKMVKELLFDLLD